MVNVEKFAERLKIMMDYYELSAALLAEKIEVQRSSISHILSGRNKPSLEFVLKILKSFPEVELYWLLNGVGSFPKSVEKSKADISPAPTTVEKHKLVEEAGKSILEAASQQAIERIVVFFKDGSFKNYNP